jgi:multidrug resistance efflux pump
MDGDTMAAGARNIFRLTVRLIELGVLLSAAGALVYFGWRSFEAEKNPVTPDVEPARAVTSAPREITGRGTVRAPVGEDIVCRLRSAPAGGVPIKRIVPDGSRVRKGDMLWELDDSGLQERLKTQRATADAAQAAFVQADENYKIIQTQNQGDSEAAKGAIDLALLDLEKFEEGDFPRTLNDLKGRIQIAEADRDIQQDRAAWARRMVKKGYLTQTQADAEQFRLQSNESAVAKLREDMRVLISYGKSRTESDLKNKCDECGRNLERVRQQGTAKEIQADSERQSKQALFLEELGRCHDLEADLKSCMVTAPVDGKVLHAGGRGTRPRVPLAIGRPVHDGELLMRLPDLKQLVVELKLGEGTALRVRAEERVSTGFRERLEAVMLFNPSLVGRLAGQCVMNDAAIQLGDHDTHLVYGGQSAEIRLDSIPGRFWHGHVKAVQMLSSSAPGNAPRDYEVLISIDDPSEDLPLGAAAEVTIATE